MDQGRIIERGSHRELWKNRGCMPQMWALQQEQQTNRKMADLAKKILFL